MHRILAGAMFTVLAFCGLSASAEVLQPGDKLVPGSRMARFLFSPPFLDSMQKQAAMLDRVLGIACREAYTVTPISVTVVRKIDLPDGERLPSNGSWIVRYDAIRCGMLKRYNLAFKMERSRRIGAIMWLPGDTMASVRLVGDTTPSVFSSAKRALGAECKPLRVADTIIVERSTAIREAGRTFLGPWRESWILQGCEKRIDVPVSFLPNDNGGTTYVVHPAVVHAIR